MAVDSGLDNVDVEISGGADTGASAGPGDEADLILRTRVGFREVFGPLSKEQIASTVLTAANTQEETHLSLAKPPKANLLFNFF